MKYYVIYNWEDEYQLSCEYEEFDSFDDAMDFIKVQVREGGWHVSKIIGPLVMSELV
jgi:hypothetical protein